MDDLYDDLDPQGGIEGGGLDSSAPTPEGEGASTGEQSNEEMIRQNVELRRALREERAGRLVDRYRLPAPYKTLLSDVPRDKQDLQARTWAEELGQRYPTAGNPDPDLDPAPNAPATPPTGEPSPENPDTKLLEEIRGARSWSELAAVQNAQPRQWERDAEAGRGAVFPEEAKTAQTWDEFATAIDKARAEARAKARERGRT